MAVQIESGRPPDWVPVERRWLGLDKRTVPAALVAFLVIVVFRGILPAIDAGISADREIQAGDVVALGDGVTFVPAQGWGFPDGLLTSDKTVSNAERTNLDGTLTNAGITITAHTAAFTEAPDALLANTKRINTEYSSIKGQKFLSDPQTITTDSGITGLMQSFTSVGVQGLLVVFVVDGIGIEFVVSGPPDSMMANDDAIMSMIESLDRASAEATQ